MIIRRKREREVEVRREGNRREGGKEGAEERRIEERLGREGWK